MLYNFSSIQLNFSPLHVLNRKYLSASGRKTPPGNIIWRSFQVRLCHLKEFWESRSTKTTTSVV